MNKPIFALAISVFLLAACASSPEPAPAPAPQPQSPLSPPPAPPKAAPAAAPAPARCDATVTFQKDETFAFDRYVLTAAAKQRLDQDVLGKLRTCASIEAVVIEGHADRIGSQQYNQKLSQHRADSVKAYLAEKGVPRDKVETIGMGKTVPAKFCPDIKDHKELIACLAPNRRAITSIKGTSR